MKIRWSVGTDRANRRSTLLTLIFLADLPDLFTSFWGHFSLFSIDISVLPLNCFVDSNFHSRLVATTVFPILFVFGIMVVWLFLRQRLIAKDVDDLQASLSKLASQSIRLCVMFLFTVFPMVLNQFPLFFLPRALC